MSSQSQKSKRLCTLTINSIQKNNPNFASGQIKHIAQDNYPVDFRYSDIKTSVIFLSLLYHYNSPLYVNNKLETVRKTEYYKTDIVILAIIQDTEDTKNYLYDIQIKCLSMGVQVILFKNGAAFSSFLKTLQTDN